VTDRLRFEIVSAVRSLGRAPATVIGAILTLAVAVGLNLAMFGLIDRAILSPPSHVSAPDRVFTVGFEVPGSGASNGAPARMTTTSYVTFDAIRQRVPKSVTSAAWQRLTTAALVNGTQVSADAMLVSGAYFDLLGAKSSLGRVIAAADDEPPAGMPVALLGYGFWIETFGGDRALLGRQITIRGIDFTIVGVMPAGFGGHAPQRVDVWLPFHAAMRQTPGWDLNQFRNFASIVVRLPADVAPIAIAEQASSATGRRVALTPIGGDGITSTEQRIAYWLTGISALVLAIGIANAATLLLVRSAARRRETAIRSALGATRGRLAVQVIVESTLLTITAVAAALVLASWFDDGVRRVLLPSVVQSAGLNLRLVSVAAMIALVIGVVSGAAQMPAQFSDDDLAGASIGRPRRRLQRTLLVVQTTLSVVLLAGAGLFGRSFYILIGQDFGMRMDGVLLVEFEGGPEGPRGLSEQLAGALDRVRVLPGVTAVTPIRQIPFTGFHVPPISVPGLADAPNVNGQLPYLIAATPELFDILAMRTVEGRRFTAADDRGAPVVIVNETMARTVWPGRSALGKCIRIGFEPSFDPFTAAGPPPPPTTVPCREVVGVVRDVRQRSVIPTGAEDRLMQYFVPFDQVPLPPAGIGTGPGVQGLLLRTTLGPDVLAPSIRSAIVDGRTDLPFLRVRWYADVLDRQVRPWRLGTVLLSIFGGLALVVAGVGLYAAFAHTVAERRREMAIRLAIGAHTRGVLMMILREASVVSAIGIICGCLLTAAGGRWLQSMLFGTVAFDPLVLGATAAVMLAVSTVATFVPALSASRTDPSTLLRVE
jgi:predicted permease